MEDVVLFAQNGIVQIVGLMTIFASPVANFIQSTSNRPYRGILPQWFHSSCPMKNRNLVQYVRQLLLQVGVIVLSATALYAIIAGFHMVDLVDYFVVLIVLNLLICDLNSRNNHELIFQRLAFGINVLKHLIYLEIMNTQEKPVKELIF